jgi:phosphatidylinositol alpha-1,6-mannosyltransferase
MKKVLLVTRPLTPPWDEASKNFAFYLAKNIPDVEFNILTSAVLPDLPANIRQRQIYTSGNFSFFQKLRLIWNLRKIQKEFDIIHYLFTPTKLNSFLIKNFVNFKKNKKIRTIQTIATLREDLYSDLEIKKMFFGDLLITYSEYAKNKLQQIGFSNVQHVYPGIDTQFYQKKDKNASLLQKCNFSNSDFILNFSGEYTRLGAIDLIISSFMEISKIIPNAKLSLAVRVKNEKDARKKKAVIETLKKNNLVSRVAFHDDGSFEMPEIYNLCDLSLFPVENMRGKFDVPLVVVEAMACEKPVVISNLPILKEFAREESSVIIEKENVANLSAAVLSLWKNPERRDALGKQARVFVMENFEIKNIAEKYKEIYKTL